MTQIATVKRIIDGERAEISVQRSSACAHDCQDCAGCGLTGRTELCTQAANPIGAEPGQEVLVESSTPKTISLAILLYLVPLVLLVAGYLLAAQWGGGEGICYAAAGVGFLLGFLPALWMNRRLRTQTGPQFTIIALR